MIQKAKTIARYLLRAPCAGTPLEVYLIITDACNERCGTCNFWKGIYVQKDSAIMTTAEIKGLLDQMSEAGIPMLIITGGEPFLRKDIFELLRYARQKIPYVRVQTNGSLITQGAAKELAAIGVDELWVSLDGSEETHDSIRGVKGSWKATVQGIEYIQSAKKSLGTATPNIMLNTVVNKMNILELSAIAQLGVRLGAGEILFNYIADVHQERLRETEHILGASGIFSGQFSTQDTLSSSEHRLKKEVVRELREIARDNKIPVFIDPLLLSGASERKVVRCILLWMNVVISPYGEVAPCQMMDRYIMGNIRREPLLAIWNNKRFTALRKRCAHGLPVCSECCSPRRKIIDHLKAPANFKRAFLPRHLRSLTYRRNG